MPNVLVRDLPESVHKELERRAREAGQSLQQYLTAHLSRLADQPTVNDVFAALEVHHGGRVGLDQAVEDLHAERNQ
ncbi:MAG: FitA-like ribbon-helix-helix domain-containing protein [Acidimicrobiales bacterium]